MFCIMTFQSPKDLRHDGGPLDYSEADVMYWSSDVFSLHNVLAQPIPHAFVVMPA